MFVDRVKVFVKGGDGGRGCVSFRREPHVPRGGPDGGHGGKGGDVTLAAVSHHDSLLPLRYHAEFRAERGRHGGSGNKSGRSGEGIVIAVPPGTLALDEETGGQLGEVLKEGDSFLLARGGRGGRGNRSFLSNWNRAPREAEPGEPGAERWVRLELRLIADVGLLGLPNAGKSTLLSRISAARPKVADYPFTTLSPVLGVVQVDDSCQFVTADIPGILQGAHAGVGLGLEFLRHVQRTRALLHVVDTSCPGDRDPVEDLRMVREEIREWDPLLLERPQLVAASKRDAVEEQDRLPDLVQAAAALGLDVIPVSAHSGEGLERLVARLHGLLQDASATSSAGAAP